MKNVLPFFYRFYLICCNPEYPQHMSEPPRVLGAVQTMYLYFRWRMFSFGIAITSWHRMTPNNRNRQRYVKNVLTLGVVYSILISNSIYKTVNTPLHTKVAVNTI